MNEEEEKYWDHYIRSLCDLNYIQPFRKLIHLILHNIKELQDEIGEFGTYASEEEVEEIREEISQLESIIDELKETKANEEDLEAAITRIESLESCCEEVKELIDELTGGESSLSERVSALEEETETLEEIKADKVDFENFKEDTEEKFSDLDKCCEEVKEELEKISDILAEYCDDIEDLKEHEVYLTSKNGTMATEDFVGDDYLNYSMSDILQAMSEKHVMKYELYTMHYDSQDNFITQIWQGIKDVYDYDWDNFGFIEIDNTYYAGNQARTKITVIPRERDVYIVLDWAGDEFTGHCFLHRTDLEELKDRVKELEARADENDEKNEEQDSRLTSLESFESEANVHFSDIDSEIEQIESKDEEQDERLDKVEKDIESTSERLDEDEADIAINASDITEIKEMIDTLQEVDSEMEERITELESCCDEVKIQITAIETTANNALSIAETASDQASEAIGTANTANSTAIEALEKASAAEASTAGAQEAAEKATEAAQEATEAAQEATEAVESLSEEVDGIKEQVDTNTDSISSIQEQVDTNTDSISSIQEQVDTNTENIEHLDENLGNTNALVDKLDEDVGNLENCCEEVQSTLTEYDERITVAQDTADEAYNDIAYYYNENTTPTGFSIATNPYMYGRLQLKKENGDYSYVYTGNLAQVNLNISQNDNYSYNITQSQYSCFGPSVNACDYYKQSTTLDLSALKDIDDNLQEQIDNLKSDGYKYTYVGLPIYFDNIKDYDVGWHILNIYYDVSASYSGENVNYTNIQSTIPIYIIDDNGHFLGNGNPSMGALLISNFDHWEVEVGNTFVPDMEDWLNAYVFLKCFYNKTTDSDYVSISNVSYSID